MTTYLLGVQWENNSIRVALLKKANSGKTSLIASAKIPTQLFKTWLAQHTPAHANVQAVLTVPESHIILKEIELPNLKGQELEEAVQWELNDKSGVGAESVTAWQVVEKMADTLHVAAMIMKKAEVYSAVEFFADAGVELTAIEPSSISAGRVVTVPGDTSILLSLEGAEVSAVFVKNRVPVFSSLFSIPLTSAAVQSKHFSRDAVSSLVSQLKRIIDYWNAKETPVKRIIVTSEASTYSGLKSYIARGFTIPLEAVQVDAAVVGAAKRVEGVVNFLPKENRVSLEKRAFGDYARMRLWQFTRVNVFVLILLAALSGFLWVSQLTQAKNIAQTQRFVNNHPAQKYVAHISSVNALAKEISTLMTRQEDTGGRLRYLSSVTPPKVHFTNLKMVNGTHEEWLVTGTGDRGDILAFYYKLKSDGQVRDLHMPYTNFNRESGSPFTLTIVW